MTLTLITTGSKTALIEEARDLLSKALACGNDAIWVLPDRQAARAESALMSATIPVGIETMTFAGLLDSLWMLYGDGRRLVDRETRDLLLQAALAERGASLGSLTSSAAVRDALSRVIAAGDVPHERPVSGPYRALAETIEDYRTLLHDSGIIEPIDAVRHIHLPERDGVPTLVISGFDELSALQIALIEMVSKRFETSILIQYDDAAPAAEALDPLRAGILGLGARERIVEGTASRSAVAGLARVLGTGERAALPSGVIRFIEAQTFEAERSAVADAVAQRLASGVPAHDIAVTGWGMTQSADTLSELLESRGIPVEVDIARPLVRTHFGRAVIAVIDAVTTGDRVAAITALSSSFLPIDGPDVDALDARWRRSASLSPQDTIDAVYPRSGRAAALLRDAREAMRHPMGERWAKAMHLLVNRLFSAAIEAERPAHLVREDGAAHAAILNAVSAAGDLAEATDATRFRRSLVDLTVATGAAVRGEGVLITEIRRLRNRSFDTVVFTGLDADTTDPSVQDSLASRIARAFGAPERLNPQVRQFGELYLALLAVRAHAVFTRTGLDLGSQPERPSRLWTEITQRVDAPDDAVEHAALRLPESDPHPRPRQGVLEEPRSLTVLAAERSYSVTELERYAACPYQWFVSRALSPRSIDEDSETLVYGSVVHEALRIVHQRAVDELPARRITPDDLEAARSWIPDALDAAYASVANGTMSAIDRQWARAMTGRIASMLARDAVMDPGLRPFQLEWRFSDAPLGDFIVHGRVDRIDATETHLVITDYKTGQIPSRGRILSDRRIQPLIYGLVASQRFEKPLAATVFRRIADERASGIELKGALSTPLTSPNIAGDQDRMDADLAWALEQAQAAVAGIRSGRIEPTPRASACQYCPAIEYCEVAYR